MRAWLFLPLTLFVVAFTGETVSSPQPFMSGLFAQFPNVRDLAISPGGAEIYFTIESYRKEFCAIACVKKQEKGWSEPFILPFSGKYRDLEPFLSADGLKLYFSSARPVSDTATKPKDVDVWYVTRPTMGSAWSMPVNMGAAINTAKDEYYPSVAKSGNLYFTRFSEDAARKEDIFVSKFSGGQYEKAVALNDSINSAKYEYNAFIAPDESYIIFTSYGRADDLGGSDLYISVKNSKGEWTAAQHMGGVNSPKIDYCPFVDPATGTLYFTSERSDVKAFHTTQQQIDVFTGANGPNGQSRIYSVPFDPGKYRRGQ
jgi:hypothetical protein